MLDQRVQQYLQPQHVLQSRGPSAQEESLTSFWTALANPTARSIPTCYRITGMAYALTASHPITAIVQLDVNI